MRRLPVVALAVLLALTSACSSEESTANTYADHDGRLWYRTDCPDAPVLLLDGAEALRPKEPTERGAVETFADRWPGYRAIPRNGWVWEKASDGSISVIRVEDYMLEKTIQSEDECPSAPTHDGDIPIAYRIDDD